LHRFAESGVALILADITRSLTVALPPPRILSTL